MQANCETVFHPRSGQRGTNLVCKKDPNQCKAKTKCTACIKRQEMSKIRDAYLESKEKGEVKSYKIVVDSEQENGKLRLNEVDSQFEQQHYVIEIKET